MNPETYLHVFESQSGQSWIVPIGDNDTLDAEELSRDWIEREFCGELEMDGEPWENMKSLAPYYARVMTDGRSPDSPIHWDSCGFCLRSTY